MHRQQFAWVVAVEGDQVCNLLALRLGHFEALTLLDFEADVASRGQRDWLAGREDGRGFAHAAILEVLGAKIAAEQPSRVNPRVASSRSPPLHSRPSRRR